MNAINSHEEMQKYCKEMTEMLETAPEPTTPEECKQIIDVLQQNSASLKKTVKQLEEARDKLIK